MRVLFVGHTYVVGVNQRKLEAVAETGSVEVALLAPMSWRFSDLRAKVRLDESHPRIRRYPARVLWTGRSGAYLYPPGTLLEALADFQPDLVQVEQEVFALSTCEIAVAARRKGIPLVVMCCESVDRRLSILRRTARDHVLHSARLLIAGNAEAGQLLRKWGYTGPLEVIPQLGVDTELFSPRTSPNVGQTFVVGFVGRLVYQKGIDLIFAAVRLLRERNYPCEVMVCGAGRDELGLRRHATQQGVARWVRWRPAVRNDLVPDELAQMDALVLASRTVPGNREQFGHVLIEAMSMCIPVIGSDCGEIPRVIGRQDVIFREGDVAGLARIIERMMCDPRWRREVAQFGLARAREVYSHERVAARLVEAWGRVVETVSRAPGV